MSDEKRQQEWFTPKEAAEYLRVSVATIYRLTQQGRLPAYRIGTARRYRREDLDAVPERIQPDGEGD